MADTAKKIGRPLRKGSNLDVAREAILNGCSIYETACLAGISMYMFGRLRKELRLGDAITASGSSNLRRSAGE